MKPLKPSESDLRAKARELEKREAALNEREAQIKEDVPDKPKPHLRDNLYSRIDIPLKVMDMIVWGVGVLLVLSFVIGILVR